jgi:hypothetical protein
MKDITTTTKIRLTGTKPLLMARGEAANPFDKQAELIRSISQKRKKTQEDHEALAQLQFNSSMYYDSKIGPYLPVDNLWKCCQQGAAKFKESAGVKSQVMIRGLIGKHEDEGAAALIYNGPRDLAGLYASGFAYLKMGKLPGSGKSVLTSRARFNEWAVEFVVEYDNIETSRIMDYWHIAGRAVGIGAWRLRHGMFTAEVIK